MSVLVSELASMVELARGGGHVGKGEETFGRAVGGVGRPAPNASVMIADCRLRIADCRW